MFKVRNRNTRLLYWSMVLNVFKVTKGLRTTLVNVTQVSLFLILNTFCAILQGINIAFLFQTWNMHLPGTSFSSIPSIVKRVWVQNTFSSHHIDWRYEKLHEKYLDFILFPQPIQASVPFLYSLKTSESLR